MKLSAVFTVHFTTRTAGLEEDSDGPGKAKPRSRCLALMKKKGPRLVNSEMIHSAFPFIQF